MQLLHWKPKEILREADSLNLAFDYWGNCSLTAAIQGIYILLISRGQIWDGLPPPSDQGDWKAIQFGSVIVSEMNGF